MNEEEKEELKELINLMYNGHISQYGKRKLEEYIKKLQKELENIKEYVNSEEFLDWHLGFKSTLEELEYRKDRINELLEENK